MADIKNPRADALPQPVVYGVETTQLLAVAVSKDALSAVVTALTTDVVRAHDIAAQKIAVTLRQFATDATLIKAAVNINDMPAQISAVLRQPDGSPVQRVRVALRSASVNGSPVMPPEAREATTLSDGSVVIRLPDVWRSLQPRSIDLAVIGGNGTTNVTLLLSDLGREGNAQPVTLPRHVDPVSLALFASLDDLLNDNPGATPAADLAVRHEVALGEGDCGIVFRTGASQDRFPYGVFFRLTDPGVSVPTLAGTRKAAGDRPTDLRAIFPDEVTANFLGGLSLHAVERVAIDRPISIDAFKRTVSGVDTPRHLPMAATLSIGYVVHLAQRWTQRGLALGDLVYSLPLAPGEQQRIAVTERTATSSVIERESLEQREDLRFDETDTSSTHATFGAAFQESAQGGSSYEANSSAFSVAAAAGGGGVFPFGAFAGGVATSYGSANAAGSTNNWMSGARQSTSTAAQSTQAAVSRRASANRSASRAAMRLATSTETTSVTTKVITNHNKTRAMTMQYWEVLRLFDVATIVEDVSLVCLVPLDIIDFLPAGQTAHLSAVGLNRERLLIRYARLLDHADVLARTVPWRLRRGLQALTDFVADPRATVQAPTGAALNVVTVQVAGRFTEQDQVWAQLMLRSGIRTATIALSGSSTPLPTGASAFTNEAALFSSLRSARMGDNSASIWSGAISLPSSVGVQDVVGIVLTRSVRPLVYTYAPDGVALAQSLLNGNPAELASVLAGLVSRGSITRSYDANQVSRELGDLYLTSVSATVSATTLVDQHWQGSMALPESGLTVSAARLPPELSYDSLLEIERTLQWVLRNTMTCTIRIAASLTAEERAAMLERYAVTPPTIDRKGVVSEGVSLLSCVTNNVLGFFGNAMVMPFQIPAGLAQEAGVENAQLQRTLKRFHTEGFDNPTSVVALPTKGVLGEAVLGRCPSAERIDLTRFWNWQDSPGDEATQITPVTMPASSLLDGSEAPSKLGNPTPIINNFSTVGPTADSSLITAIAGKAIELGAPFEVDKLTNSGGLTTIVTKTADNAEAARKDALASATKLAEKAMDAAVSINAAKAGNKPSNPPSGTPPADPV